jgi:hypothetical protein
VSILTKIFVVLVTLLSVALLAFLVPLVSNQENYKEKLGIVSAQKSASDQAAAVASTKLKAFETETVQLVTGLRTEISGKDQLVSTMRQDLEREREMALREKARADKADTSVSTLSASVKQLGEMQDKQSTELSGLRDQSLKLARQAVEAATKINDLRAQSEQQERLIRRQKEETARLTDELVKLNQAIAKLPEEIRVKITGPQADENVTGVPQPSGPISAQITKVTMVDGEPFAEMNVGKADGVIKAMRFWVSRGSNQFVARLTVITVDDRTSAGRLDLVQERVVVGDRALAVPGM